MKFSKKSSKNRKITKRTAKRKNRKQKAGFNSDECTGKGLDGNKCNELLKYDDSADDIAELNESIAELQNRITELKAENSKLKSEN